MQLAAGQADADHRQAVEGRGPNEVLMVSGYTWRGSMPRAALEPKHRPCNIAGVRLRIHDPPLRVHRARGGFDSGGFRGANLCGRQASAARQARVHIKQRAVPHLIAFRSPRPSST